MPTVSRRPSALPSDPTLTHDAPSADWFERAHRVTPGGVNSPVRAFNAVGGTPRFMASGPGAWLRDVDGNEYVDLICSWGPLLLGPRPPRGRRPRSPRR